MLKIGILLGDDIGLEVVPEAVKVMKAAAAKAGLQVEWQPLPIGRKAHETHGHTMPDSTVEALKGVDGWLQGPIGHNAYPRNDTTWINPPLRKKFELFANVKPVKSYPNLPSLHKNMDVVFVRETTEGLARSGTVVAGLLFLLQPAPVRLVATSAMSRLLGRMEWVRIWAWGRTIMHETFRDRRYPRFVSKRCSLFAPVCNVAYRRKLTKRMPDGLLRSANFFLRSELLQ